MSLCVEKKGGVWKGDSVGWGEEPYFESDKSTVQVRSSCKSNK